MIKPLRKWRTLLVHGCFYLAAVLSLLLLMGTMLLHSRGDRATDIIYCNSRDRQSSLVVTSAFGQIEAVLGRIDHPVSSFVPGWDAEG